MSENVEMTSVSHRLRKSAAFMSASLSGSLLDYDLNTMQAAILGIFLVSLRFIFSALNILLNKFIILLYSIIFIYNTRILL